MPQRSSFIYKTLGIGIAILCLLSCAPKPELEWIPQIKSVSAEVNGNICVLTAEASAELTGGYAYGFLYGKNEDNMRRVHSDRFLADSICGSRLRKQTAYVAGY